jgi:hypothetical protein
VLNAALVVIGLWRAVLGWPQKDPHEIDYFEHLSPAAPR